MRVFFFFQLAGKEDSGFKGSSQICLESRCLTLERFSVSYSSECLRGRAMGLWFPNLYRKTVSFLISCLPLFSSPVLVPDFFFHQFLDFSVLGPCTSLSHARGTYFLVTFHLLPCKMSMFLLPKGQSGGNTLMPSHSIWRLIPPGTPPGLGSGTNLNLSLSQAQNILVLLSHN